MRESDTLGVLNGSTDSFSVFSFKNHEINHFHMHFAIVGIQIPDIWMPFGNLQGSILSTKKFSEFWPKSQISWNFHKFLNCIHSKYSEENFQKSVQPPAPKYFVWKFLTFWKNWRIQNYQIFVSQKIFQNLYFLDRVFDWQIQLGYEIWPLKIWKYLKSGLFEDWISNDPVFKLSGISYGYSPKH